MHFTKWCSSTELVLQSTCTDIHRGPALSTKPQKKTTRTPTMCILWKFQLLVASRTCCVVHVGFILHALFIHFDCSHLIIIKKTSRFQWRFPRHQNHWWIDDLDYWTFHHIRCWNSPFWVYIPSHRMFKGYYNFCASIIG